MADVEKSFPCGRQRDSAPPPKTTQTLGARMASFHGSCLCQTIQYKIIGEPKAFYLCHCSRCRKVTGSAHASNLFVHVESMQWLAGESMISSYRVPDTRFAKSFCSQCSSAVPSLRPPSHVLIPAGSLDSEPELTPQAHISCASRAAWDDGFANLECIPGLPGSK